MEKSGKPITDVFNRATWVVITIRNFNKLRIVNSAAKYIHHSGSSIQF